MWTWGYWPHKHRRCAVWIREYEISVRGKRFRVGYNWMTGDCVYVFPL